MEEFEKNDIATEEISVETEEKEEKEEIIKTENILKYEYFPTEKVNTDKKDNILKYTFIEGDKMGVRACIGYNIEEELQAIDVLDGHIVVGGTARWGKSNFLNVFITNIIKTYTPNEVQLAGSDFKKSDVYYFRKYKHFENAGVSTNKEGFLNQIKALEKEMERRANILDEANCRNAISYNKKNDTKMTYIVFIVDELIQVTIDAECRNKLHNIKMTRGSGRIRAQISAAVLLGNYHERTNVWAFIHSEEESIRRAIRS